MFHVLCYVLRECMIYTLSGKISYKNNDFLVVEVAGIGYQVFVTTGMMRFVEQGQEIKLFTHQYVREDALNLYGFSTKNELVFFEQLLGISGIGPKSALGVLGVAPVEELQTAIQKGDTHFLTKVSGIGKKTAERVVLELRDKLVESDGEQSGAGATRSEEIEALEGLGYSASDAREALVHVPADITDVAERVKAALQILGK